MIRISAYGGCGFSGDVTWDVLGWVSQSNLHEHVSQLHVEYWGVAFTSFFAA